MSVKQERGQQKENLRMLHVTRSEIESERALRPTAREVSDMGEEDAEAELDGELEFVGPIGEDAWTVNVVVEDVNPSCRLGVHKRIAILPLRVASPHTKANVQVDNLREDEEDHEKQHPRPNPSRVFKSLH